MSNEDLTRNRLAGDPPQINPTSPGWIALAAAAEPLLLSLISCIAALRKKYSQLTDSQVQEILVGLAQNIHMTTAATMAGILVDQEAHKDVAP